MSKKIFLYVLSITENSLYEGYGKEEGYDGDQDHPPASSTMNQEKDQGENTMNGGKDWDKNCPLTFPALTQKSKCGQGGKKKIQTQHQGFTRDPYI